MDIADLKMPKPIEKHVYNTSYCTKQTKFEKMK